MALPRVGDSYTYSGTVMDYGPTGEVVRTTDQTIQIEVLGYGNGHGIVVGEGQCLEVRVVIGDRETIHCLDPHDLSLRGRWGPTESFGVPHIDWTFPLHEATAVDFVFDGVRFPLATTVFAERDGNASYSVDIPALVAEATSIRRTSTDSEGSLTAHLEYPDRIENVDATWRAGYEREAPLPTRINLSMRNTTFSSVVFRYDFFLISSFDANYQLVRYDPGGGPLIAQEAGGGSQAVPGSDSAEGTGPGSSQESWERRLDPGPPITRYPLESAWDYALENDSGLKEYLNSHEAIFPVSVAYRSIRDSLAGYIYEWNVTF